MKLDELVPVADALAATVAKIGELGGVKSVDNAMIMAREAVVGIAKRNLAQSIRDEMQDIYDTHVMIHGELPENARTFQVMPWIEPFEEQLQNYFDGYSALHPGTLSASWLGTVDNITPRRADDVVALANSFANEVYKNLIHYWDEQADALKEKTAAQVLSAVGIVRADIEQLIGQQTETIKEIPAMPKVEYDLKEMIEAMHDYVSMTGTTGKRLEQTVENATDSDANIAYASLAALGMTPDAAHNLRDIRKRYGVEHLCVMIENNTYAARQDAPPEEEIDLSQFTAASSFTTTVAAPPPETRGRKPKTDVLDNRITDGGTIPPTALKVIKEFTGLKGEDIGVALGVSRATFDNYVKGKGPRLHATNANKDYLLGVLDERLTALAQAKQEILNIVIPPQ